MSASPFLDDLAEVRDDGRVVLAFGVEHHHHIGAHLERLAVAGLLVPAIAEVSLVSDHVEPERRGDASRWRRRSRIDQQDPVGVALRDVAYDLERASWRRDTRAAR